MYVFAHVHVYAYIKDIYYMAQVTSGKIARCDWWLTWRDLSLITAGTLKIMPCEQKQTQNTTQIILIKCFFLKTKNKY